MSDEIKLTLNPIVETGTAGETAVAAAAEDALQEAQAIAQQVQQDADQKQHFSEEEQQMITEFSKQIDVTDANLVFS